MHGNSTRENRETPATPVGEDAAGRLEKALSPKSNMHVAGESDGRAVPTKGPHQGEQAPEIVGETRVLRQPIPPSLESGGPGSFVQSADAVCLFIDQRWADQRGTEQ